MRVKTVISAYAIAPVLVMILVNTFTYNVTPIWTNQMKHYCMEMTFDKNIPFVPVFVVIYILAYVQWFVGYYAVVKTYCNKKVENPVFDS